MEPEKQSEKTSQHFGDRAEAYVASRAHAQGPDLEQMRKLVGRRPQAEALDLGCGGGHTAFALAELVGSVTAADPSAKMLTAVETEAKRRGLENILTLQTRAETLEAVERFDLVVTRFSAHHWSSLEDGLRRMRRAVKPGGLAILMDTVSPEPPLVDSWLQTYEMLHDPTHVRDYTVSEWRSKATAAGFSVDEVELYRLRLEFARWTETAQTPEPLRQAMLCLCARAPQEVVEALQMGAEGGFSMPTMLLSAHAI